MNIAVEKTDQAASLPPLCVDLDATLAASNIFLSSLARLIRKNLLYVVALPYWLLRGPAFFKEQVMKKAPRENFAARLHEQFVQFLQNEHLGGRELVLVTAVNYAAADLIFRELPLFSEVLRCGPVSSAAESAKARCLVDRYGRKGFDYLSDAAVEDDVLQAAHTPFVYSAVTGVSEVDSVRQTAVVLPVGAGCASRGARLADHVSIARPDHWFKNIFVIPGVLLVPFFFPVAVSWSLLVDVVVAVWATCLVASSNYVVNEILDAEYDRHHPVKRFRPLAAGRVSVPLAYVEWVLLGLIGVWTGFAVNTPVGLATLALWIMGCVYNIPPIRSKEVPFLDVLSESVNNPIRMTIGWYAVGVAVVPPVSALFAYWMLGAFLMATKRFAEYRRIGDPELAARYRGSFRFYNEERLLAGNVFYISLFMTGAMAFIMLYRLELVFAIPVFAYMLAYYVYLGFKPDSPVQYPELLYKERHLCIAVILSSLWCVALLFMVDLPWFEHLFVLLTPQG